MSQVDNSEDQKIQETGCGERAEVAIMRRRRHLSAIVPACVAQVFCKHRVSAASAASRAFLILARTAVTTRTLPNPASAMDDAAERDPVVFAVRLHKE